MRQIELLLNAWGDNIYVVIATVFVGGIGVLWLLSSR